MDHWILEMIFLWTAWRTSMSNRILISRFSLAIQSFRDFIGQTTGCPTSQRIVRLNFFDQGGHRADHDQALMGVAADCEYVTLLGSQQNATRQLLNSFNTASTLYKVGSDLSRVDCIWSLDRTLSISVWEFCTLQSRIEGKLFDDASVRHK